LYAHSAQEDCVRALSWLDAPREPDGVTFADQRPNDALIGLMAQSGFARAMVDTARKNGGRLLDRMDIAVIGNLSIVHAPTA
jgi:(5-formylfuran-3-yl)methyl phosphate synthase